MTDIFDTKIVCTDCNVAMHRHDFVRNGFHFRAVMCPKCNDKILHPMDEQEYQRFISLKNRQFEVKMRMVGNSYSVSIPKEIVSFMHEQERAFDDMVRLCLEEMGRVSIQFKEHQERMQE